MSQNVPEEKNSELALILASGVTITSAAEQTQVCRKTVQRKLADPEFRKLVSDLRRQMFTDALGRMAEHATRAADALGTLVDGDDPALRLRAARAVLSLGLRLNDAVDVSERMDELERQFALRQGARP